MQATETLSCTNSTLHYLRTAEDDIDVLCTSWIANDAALGLVSQVLLQAHRDMRYDVSLVELFKIKEDAEARAARIHVAVDAIKVRLSQFHPEEQLPNYSSFIRRSRST